MDFKKHINDVPGFPIPGVIFRDISPLLKDKFQEAIKATGDLLTEEEWDEIDVIAGIDSRGFIFASALAQMKNKGLVLIRKAGKIPNPAGQKEFGLEYARAAIEMHAGTGNILIVDDVLATGNSLKAACTLAKEVGYDVKNIIAFINLTALNDFSWEEHTARSVVEY